MNFIRHHQVLERKTLVVWMLGLICCSTCFGAQEVSTDFIPSSAFMLVDAKPKSAMAQPSMALIPREIIKVFGEKELGIDLLEIKRISFLMDPIEDPEMRRPPEFGMVVQFDSAQKLSDKFLSEFEKSAFEDKTAYQLDPDASLVLIDDQTMLVGMNGFLKKMLNAQGASSPLIERYKQMPADDHLNVAMIVEPVRALIKQNLPGEDEVPPPFREFFQLPDLVRSLSYRANFSPNEISELMIEATDERATRRIVKMIDYGIDLAKSAALAAMAEEIDFEDPDYQQAVVAYTERLSEAIRNGLKPQIDGVQLVYDLKAQGRTGATSVATTGILIGMLLPAVQQAREAARRVESQNRLRQLALATLNYESAFRRFPTQANYDDQGRPLLSWRVHILPYIEQNALYEKFKLDEPWDSPHNIQLLDEMPDAFKSANFDDPQRTLFLGVSGPGTVFDGDKKTTFGNITDGSSNTALMVEADPAFAVEWTRPRDWELDKTDPLRGLGNLRPGGFNTCFCDGSTHFVSNTLNPETWANICQKADGNIVDWNW